ncbi:transcriptional regulator, LysR family protein [Marinomonas sp. MED121]|uniref:LysR family transcriptional regulator n=1 Tax=Marinomonas sp. MED121 TaxID=314277 RepID=UPI000069114A|nr:LysR family transcriptional regulator [Marinomonas sp. MED121]EAQ67722.1 transcriptional regulator, LysR family protein [Marinomonas sp. MED121]
MLSESIISPIISTLPVFLEAARSGSFTKASKRLNISQPSVSRNILMLEKYLGVSLFERNQNRLILTKEGHKLYLATANGFEHMESILMAIQPKITGSKVSMGCPTQLIPWLSTKVSLLSHFFGEADIVLEAAETCKFGKLEGVNIAIQFGRGDWPGYESELLIKEEIFPVCAPSLERKFNWYNKLLTPKDLVNQPLLPSNRNEKGYLSWNDWFAHFNVSFCQCNQYDDYLYTYPLNIESAILGKGIILAWKGSVESQIHCGQLMELPGMRLKGLNGYYLVYPADAWFASDARKWAELVRAEKDTD